jgi:hypothetical protein
MFYLNWLSVRFVRNLACCFEGVYGAIFCPGIFGFGSKLAHSIFQQVKKNRPRVPQGRPTSVQGGTPHPPRGSQKKVAKTKRVTAGIRKFVCILGDIVRCFVRIMRLMLFKWLFRSFSSLVSIIFIFVWMCSKLVLKLADCVNVFGTHTGT